MLCVDILIVMMVIYIAPSGTVRTGCPLSPCSVELPLSLPEPHHDPVGAGRLQPKGGRLSVLLSVHHLDHPHTGRPCLSPLPGLLLVVDGEREGVEVEARWWLVIVPVKFLHVISLRVKLRLKHRRGAWAYLGSVSSGTARHSITDWPSGGGGATAQSQPRNYQS